MSSNITAEKVKAFGAFFIAAIALLGVVALAVSDKSIPDILTVVVAAAVGFFFGVANTNGATEKIAQAMTAIDAVNAARVRHDTANAVTVESLSAQLVARGILSPDEAAAIKAKAAASMPLQATIREETGNLA